MEQVIYTLPHGFYITEDKESTYTLWCNGKFVYWNECVDNLFMVFGKHLKLIKG
jgi:hypothetical protein